MMNTELSIQFREMLFISIRFEVTMSKNYFINVIIPFFERAFPFNVSICR